MTAFDRLIALDPETGKELWAFDPKLDKVEAADVIFQSQRGLLARWKTSACSMERSTDSFGRSIPRLENRSTPSGTGGFRESFAKA